MNIILGIFAGMYFYLYVRFSYKVLSYLDINKEKYLGSIYNIMPFPFIIKLGYLHQSHPSRIIITVITIPIVYLLGLIPFMYDKLYIKFLILVIDAFLFIYLI